MYAWGVWEDTIGVNHPRLYSFGGQVVAQRESVGDKVNYLHGDHLGSVSVVTDANDNLASRQEFGPWGNVRSGGAGSTTLNYTGQRLDDTGLLFYNARYYDPAIGRFISADTVVPGNASGGMDGVALRPLTVAFHETGFIATLNRENQFGPWYTLSDDARRQVGNPWGPTNPQALNRYSYVLNNPMRWTDPSGHNPLALALIGLGVVAPVAAAVVASLAVATVLWCLSDEGCRAWVSQQVNAGISNVDGFVEALSGRVEAPTVLESRQSGKERASDIPSWAKGQKALPGEKPSETAKRLLDDKYGEGNWDQGPTTEYNRLKKFYERNR